MIKQDRYSYAWTLAENVTTLMKLSGHYEEIIASFSKISSKNSNALKIYGN